jgi:hypothetical protein
VYAYLTGAAVFGAGAFGYIAKKNSGKKDIEGDDFVEIEYHV